MSRLSGRELALTLLFWIGLATLSSVNWLFDPRGPGFRIGRTGPIAMTYIEAGVWALLTPLIFWLVARLSERTSTFAKPGSAWIRLPVLILAGIVISIGVFVCLDFVRSTLVDVPVRRGGGAAFAPLRGIARFRFASHLLVYCAVLGAGYARLFFLRERAGAMEAVQLRAQLSDARLAALRMQLNPHFLFNTLHAISALVERDPSGVRKIIARLSELLRHTVDSKAADEVPLAEEVAFLRRYLEIMEIRFQGRLRIRIEIPDALSGAYVPNLILQPIVENALEHGVARASGEGKLDIEGQRDGDSLILTVRDNGPGIEGSPSSGVGVANTRARLAQLYGGAASLTLNGPAGGGTSATIVLRFHEAKRV
jgi:two-component system, LytTR family, sensor kinase